jgi:hypothetical protein
MLKFLEHNHIVHSCPSGVIAANEDIYAGGFDSDVINMKNAETAVFMIIQNAGPTGTASIQIFACSNATPSATAAITFKYKRITSGDTQGNTTESKLLRTTAGADQVYVIEVEAAKLAEQGYGYVQMNVGEADNSPVDGAVISFLTGLRSAEDNLSTQLT